MKKLELKWKEGKEKYITQVIKDIDKYLSATDGGVSFNNYLGTEIIIESTTESLVRNNIRYEDMRLAVEEGIYRFVHYKRKSVLTLRKAITTELKIILSATGKKIYIALFYTPTKIYKSFKLEKHITLLGRKISFENWSTIKEKVEIDKFLYHANGYQKEAPNFKLVPTLIEIKEKPKLLPSKFEEHSHPYEMFRSIINFSLNFGNFPIGGHSNLPYNSFTPPESMGIFHEDGKYLTNLFTFARFKEPLYGTIRENEVNRANELLDKFSLENNTNSIESLVSSLLLQYNYSLDSHDYGSMFFGLWRILEHIAFPKKKAKYEKIPNRITTILPDNTHLKPALKAIVRARMGFFHKEAYFPWQYSTMVHLLRVINEHLIWWLINNPENLSSQNDLMVYLNQNETTK